MERVTISAQHPNYGLLPGTVRESEAVIRRVRESQSRPRETMRIDPLSSGREMLVGHAVDVRKVALADRFGIQPTSIGAKILASTFPSLRVVQITILVDELDIDPDTEDLLSYTFWCKMSDVAESVTRGDIVHVEVEPVDMLSERRWLARSMEIG